MYHKWSGYLDRIPNTESTSQTIMFALYSFSAVASTLFRRPCESIIVFLARHDASLIGAFMPHIIGTLRKEDSHKDIDFR